MTVLCFLPIGSCYFQYSNHSTVCGDAGQKHEDYGESSGELLDGIVSSRIQVFQSKYCLHVIQFLYSYIVLLSLQAFQ